MTAATPSEKPAAASSPSPAAAKPTASTQAEWEKVLAAAKQEGVVTLAGFVGETYRTALLEFSKSYPEIKVEYTGASGRDFAPKILAERQAGQFLWDVHNGGPATAYSDLRPQGVLDPLKPAILLPEVLDDSKWLGGLDGGWLLDKPGQLIYGFEGTVQAIVHVNRDVVPESELSKMEQLADPRWKGKIAWNDPRAAGGGSSDAAHLLMTLGEDFLRKVLEQEVVPTRDLRQLLDWLVRGTYPIAGGVDESELERYQQQGVGKNVQVLDANSEAGQRMSQSSGCVMLINRAPHPNAAKVYVNWLLSREGQAAWVKHTATNSRRLDVPGPLASQPDPAKKYRMIYDEANYPSLQKAQDIAKQIIK